MKNVVFDTEFLSLLLHPSAKAPIDPKTGKALTKCRERIEFLIESLQAGKVKILIPTPVLAEFLIVAGEAAQGYLSEMANHSAISFATFDTKAAVETAELEKKARSSGDKRAGTGDPWQKVKVDRQVLAIAIANNTTRLYTSDPGLMALAKQIDMDVTSAVELPVPPSKDRPLDFEAPRARAISPPSPESSETSEP